MSSQGRVTHSYAKLSSEFYDLDKPAAPEEALAFYRHYAERASGPLLEPMCGSGRFLLPLLAAGFDIEGSDTSLDMRSRCRERAALLGLSPTVHEQSIEELNLERRFGLVFIPAGSFSLLTDLEVVRKALRSVHSALKPGGMFVVEVEQLQPVPPIPTGVWHGRFLTRADNAKIILSSLTEYSGVQGILRSVHRYELVKGGKLLDVEYEDFELKFYEASEFTTLLTDAGFSRIRLLRPYDSESAAPTDDAIVFECMKQ